MQRYSFRPPAYHRPHVSVSAGFPGRLGFLGNPSPLRYAVDTSSLLGEPERVTPVLDAVCRGGWGLTVRRETSGDAARNTPSVSGQRAVLLSCLPVRFGPSQ